MVQGFEAGRRLLKSAILIGAAITLSAVSAHAANPSDSRITFSLKRVPSARGLEDLSIRITNNFPADQVVEAGGSCSVKLFACVSAFVPLGGDSGDRSCEPYLVGTKTVAAGERTVRFNMTAKPAASPPKSGRQVSFQTEATCTDAVSAQAIIGSAPRAKKVSRTDGRGVARTAFLKSLRKSLN